MHERTITAQLREHIQGIPEGKPFATLSLLRYGTRAAVDKALSRMTKAGELMRVTKGIYVKPRFNAYVGAIMPSPEAIARAAAEAENAVIQIHGAEALRLLGLSTQEATQPVFLTNGPAHNLKMGNLKIRLKHVSARNLPSLQGKPALALSALRYMGRTQVTRETIQVMKEKLSAPEYEELLRFRSSMPGWLSDMLAKAG